MRPSASASILLCYSLASCSFDIGYGDDADLTSFVTRPEIKAPKFNVDVYDPENVAPGFWFLGPYANIQQEAHARRYYQPCQTGPTIYDGNGELICSGACLFKNQNACDFRVTESNGSSLLSAILHRYDDDHKGHAMIMDNTYKVVNEVRIPKTEIAMNMHDFVLLEQGRHALYLTSRPEFFDVSSLELKMEAGWVSNIGFREIDIETGSVFFEWWALDHVDILESDVALDGIAGPFPKAWGFFHANSVDKNSDGDYLVSARFTNCVYKISGRDGSILWRLGGRKSSFKLDNFNFSRQHDARWMYHDEHTETISLLDNAADSVSSTSSYSSGLIIEIDKDSGVAKIVQRLIRPDEKLSKLRGNLQVLPNGNTFAGWSDNSYISESAPDGRLLMEARFKSKRFVTYRAYKFNFTGAPTEPPALVAHTYGASRLNMTVCYVSWNGATEVAVWRFYREEGDLIGQQKRTGFETIFSFEGSESRVFAEAVGVGGERLGRSALAAVVVRSPIIGDRKAEVDPSIRGTAFIAKGKTEL